MQGRLQRRGILGNDERKDETSMLPVPKVSLANRGLLVMEGVLWGSHINRGKIKSGLFYGFLVIFLQINHRN